METLSSCISKEPLMKFGEGEAPVLNYSIPQETCFNVYGRIPLNISQKYFTPQCFKVPANNIWDGLKLKKEKDLQKELGEIIATGYSSGVLGSSLTAIKGKLSLSVLPGVTLSAKTEVTSAKLQSKKVGAVQSSVVQNPQNAYTDFMVQQLLNGLAPIPYRSFDGEPKVLYRPKPEKPSPTLFCIETYSVCSYLGDYGAGKTLNVLSLLPGEKTEITIKTYLDTETSNTASQNILDSFSKASSDEYESLLREETNDSSTITNEVKLSLEASGVIKMIDLSGSASYDHTHETTSNVNHIEQTTNKHTRNSNHSREVTVNVTSSETVKTGTETSIVRQIENINKSRVLNFVFRQLLQEYITLISLTNVKIFYTNGYPESAITMNIFEMEDKLKGIITDDKIEEVKNRIIKKYCTVYNYKGDPKKFLEKVTQNFKDCECGNFIGKIEFCRINKHLLDEAEGIAVNGVILSVKKHTLKTPAIICDSLLGQGEALDCYNMELQKAAVESAKLTNVRSKMALDIIDGIADVTQKATTYKDLFNSCCGDNESTVA